MTPDKTSLSLLNRVQRHDHEAWKRLVDVYGPLVFAWCRRGGLSEHDARDTGQEVFADVARGIAGFRRTKETHSFRRWLRTITRHKVADHWRHQKDVAGGGSANLRQFADIPEPGSPPEIDAEEEMREGQEVCQRVLSYLRAHFHERHWQAFWRTAVDEQPAAFVAEELGMSEANVRQVKSRVLRRLRDELAELENLN